MAKKRILLIGAALLNVFAFALARSRDDHDVHAGDRGSFDQRARIQ